MDFARSFLGQIVKVQVDRPLGSSHPKHKNIVYPINYGYIPNVFGGDGEEMDVYLLGIDVPIKECQAKIIGVIHRLNDTEDKLVAVPNGMNFSKGQIRKAVDFQERYFVSEIELV